MPRRVPTRRRNSIQNLAAANGSVSKSCGVVGDHVSWRDGVYVDSFGGPLIGQCFRQLRDSTLRRRVCWDENAALKGEQRSDVHDLAVVAFLEHVKPGQLRYLKHRRQIHRDQLIPESNRILARGG